MVLPSFWCICTTNIYSAHYVLSVPADKRLKDKWDQWWKAKKTPCVSGKGSEKVTTLKYTQHILNNKSFLEGDKSNYPSLGPSSLSFSQSKDTGLLND